MSRIVVLILTDKEAKELLEVLNEYLYEHRDEIADFPSSWDRTVEVIERVKKLITAQLKDNDC